MSWSAETVSRIMSKLPACFAIASASFEMTDLVGAEPLAVGDLALRRGEQDRVRAEGVGELHAHVAEPAEPDDADLLPLARAPLAQRRVRGDPGAQQRRGRAGSRFAGTFSVNASSQTIFSE